jgi:drug/metabolite transporter (DMT)-like permease
VYSLKKTTDRDLQEPTHQPWRRFYGPFRNSRVVDWAIFVASISFLVILGVVYGSFYSLEGFRKSAFVTFFGIGIFYALGEVYRRWLVNRKSKKTDNIVLVVLFGGLGVFLAGGIYSGIFQLPTMNIPNLDLIAYAVLSMIIGLIASYLLLRAWKSRDIAV